MRYTHDRPDFSVVLPFPVSTNRIWRNRGNGITYKTKEYREFLKEVSDTIFQKRLSGVIRLKKSGYYTDGRLKINVFLYRKDKISYDIDNCPKSLLDALEKAKVFKNDSQIDVLQLVREPAINKKKSLCRVEIFEILNE